MIRLLIMGWCFFFLCSDFQAWHLLSDLDAVDLTVHHEIAHMIILQPSKHYLVQSCSSSTHRLARPKPAASHAESRVEGPPATTRRSPKAEESSEVEKDPNRLFNDELFNDYLPPIFLAFLQRFTI